MNRRTFLSVIAAVVAVPKKMLIPVRAWWVQDETPAEGVARITDWGEEFEPWIEGVPGGPFVKGQPLVIDGSGRLTAATSEAQPIVGFAIGGDKYMSFVSPSEWARNRKS